MSKIIQVINNFTQRGTATHALLLADFDNDGINDVFLTDVAPTSNYRPGNGLLRVAASDGECVAIIHDPGQQIRELYIYGKIIQPKLKTDV